jgi:hypothetical protein
VSNYGKLAPASISIVDSIRRDAATYCSEVEALAIVESIPRYLQEGASYADVEELYTISVEQFKSSSVPSPGVIGRWLDGNKTNPPYFAEPTIGTRTVKKRVRSGLSDFLAMQGKVLGDSEYTTASETYIDGFRNTADLPYVYTRIRAEPCFPNLQPADCFVVPILSRTHLRLFSSYTRLEFVDWKHAQSVETTDWTTEEVQLKDENGRKELLETIVGNFLEFVLRPIEAKWGTAPAPAPENPDKM